MQLIGFYVFLALEHINFWKGPQQMASIFCLDSKILGQMHSSQLPQDLEWRIRQLNWFLGLGNMNLLIQSTFKENILYQNMGQVKVQNLGINADYQNWLKR